VTQRIRAIVLVACLSIALAPTVHAWGAQGHRVVALLAAESLTAVARENVTYLLDTETLADVASWADQYRQANYQTFYWHFVNIPAGARGYDRDRDCLRQPTVAAGSVQDRWRDCVVERIQYNYERLADRALDRSDRAIALKFLVHLVGDLHQPFHAIGVERGGNGIAVSAFGSDNCSSDPGRVSACNLHAVWDDTLIAHRRLDDRRFVAILRESIRTHRWDAQPIGTAAEWAMESHAIATRALLPQHGAVDEAYYRRSWPAIEQRLAQGGVRLGALLNRALVAAPRSR
jgi:hypothetical protein